MDELLLRRETVEIEIRPSFVVYGARFLVARGCGEDEEGERCRRSALHAVRCEDGWTAAERRTLIGCNSRLRAEPFHPPTTHAPSPAMASTMLRRQLSSRPPRILQRCLSSTSAVRQLSQAQQGAQTTGAKNIFDTHTVEDLQGMHASDILAETGSRKEAKIRHFTGTLPPPGNFMSV